MTITNHHPASEKLFIFQRKPSTPKPKSNTNTKLIITATSFLLTSSVQYKPRPTTMPTGSESATKKDVEELGGTEADATGGDGEAVPVPGLPPLGGAPPGETDDATAKAASKASSNDVVIKVCNVNVKSNFSVLTLRPICSHKHIIIFSASINNTTVFMCKIPVPQTLL